MIIFNLDAKPISNDFRNCSDFTAKIIKHSIALPLIYCKDDDISFESGLMNIISSNKFETVMSVNKFYFSNGEILKAKHIKDSLIWTINNNPRVRSILSDLKKILIKDNNIVFKYKKNAMFLHLLTDISLSPFNGENEFCGLFSIESINNNRVIVKSNEYNNNKKSKIRFNFIKDNIEDIKLYKKGKAHFTNPTTFPVKYVNSRSKDLNVYDNYIYLSIQFKNKKLLSLKFMELRKLIYNSIKREEIAKLFSPLLLPSFNFCIKSDIDKFIGNIEKGHFESVRLRFGYDNFYPNEQIAILIKEQLEKYNIFLELYQTDFYSEKRDVDLQLTLTVPDFTHNSFYYISKYFYLLSKMASVARSKKILKYKKQFISTGNKKQFELLKNEIDNLYLEIPLFRESAVYLSKNKNFNFKKFNFDSLNFDD